MNDAISREPVNTRAGDQDAAASLQVSVALLDKLMNLAGELVLSRNQLLQGIGGADMKSIEISGQRIDMIASELQDAIMQTRMQPVAALFDAFRQKVRHLALDQGKQVNITVEGKEVELDKTVLESLRPPLDRLIENSIQNGIESPEERSRKGKDPMGRIVLRAYHDAGQVNISVSDDGCGTPSENIREAVTAGIESLGGVMEVDDVPDQGSDVQIKLPLTLAIISSQIAGIGSDRYAIPQTNLSELLRIPAAEIKDRIERVGDAQVVRLRGELLPLLNLPDMLGIERCYKDPQSGRMLAERRVNISDRRSKKYAADGAALPREEMTPVEDQVRRDRDDRRKSSALNIAVVFAGNYKYGMVIDRFYDAEEIVVKPLGHHLKSYKPYAGATIMGDGKVALILDILNLAQTAGLATMSESGRLEKKVGQSWGDTAEKTSLVVFRNQESEYFAVPFDSVQRIERLESRRIEMVGSRKVVQYRGGALPLYELSQVLDVDPLPGRDQQEVIVLSVEGRELGIMVTPPADTIEIELDLDERTFKQKGVKGSMTINGHTTLLLDIPEMVAQFS